MNNNSVATIVVLLSLVFGFIIGYLIGRPSTKEQGFIDNYDEQVMQNTNCMELIKIQADLLEQLDHKYQWVQQSGLDPNYLEVYYTKVGFTHED